MTALVPSYIRSVCSDNRQIVINKYGKSFSVTFKEHQHIVATVQYLQHEDIDAAVRHFLATGQITHGFEV